MTTILPENRDAKMTTEAPRHSPSRESSPSQRSDTGAEPSESEAETEPQTETQWSIRTQWILLAVASGACAAFNGVFAKLTTTDLTTKLAQALARFLRISQHENIVEYAVRAMFFTLNLVFNGIMWSLFTTALARGTSATQVSIINTSTNFLVTAFLGIAIFSEHLPPLWWVGSSLLVAGNVITGRKDDGDTRAAVEAEPLLPPTSAATPEADADSRNNAAASNDSDSDIPSQPL